LFFFINFAYIDKRSEVCMLSNNLIASLEKP
jgi:hypothetical protein